MKSWGVKEVRLAGYNRIQVKVTFAPSALAKNLFPAKPLFKLGQKTGLGPIISSKCQNN